MTYTQALQYLESLIDYEKLSAYPYKDSFKLDRIRNFLHLIGDPQDSLRCLHIAGSKGKGSTCAFLTYILRESGYKVGLYTSPHLSDFRERIRILSPALALSLPQADFEGMISRKDLTGLVKGLRPLIEKYHRSSCYDKLSFFEVYTAIAFMYFKRKKVDFAVLETGLGGRLDATNVVSPQVCAITPISYEHTQKLGRTLKEIAAEKAGIIKGHKPIVVSAPQKKEALEVIRKKCKLTGAKLYEVKRDIGSVAKYLYLRHCEGAKRPKQSQKRDCFAPSGLAMTVSQQSHIKYWEEGDTFSVKTKTGYYPHLNIRLLGNHQMENVAVAIGMIEGLRERGVKVSVDSIRKGLYNTVWPGRCEIVAKNPLIVLDGAQNAASARVLRETIRDRFHYQGLILILGISSDKDIQGICRELCPLAQKIILTRADSPRSASVNIIEEVIKSSPPRWASSIVHRPSSIEKTGNVRTAIGLAERSAGKKNLILVTGSLFVVGEARKLLCRV